MIKIEDLSKYSIKNKKEILNSTVCGCYYCESMFSPKEIVNWIDNQETAVCPKCNVDSVIGDSLFNIDKEFLEKAGEYWFY